MPFSLLPKIIVKELPDITEELLRDRGIELLMLDFDNTIVPYTRDEPTEETKAWLDSIRAAGIKLCIVSNSHKNRVKIFSAQYGLDCITHSRKPFSKGIEQCLQKYGLPPERCALAGDQIFTDTLGANCAGLTSILVKPIHNHTVWLKLRHVAEMPFILAAGKRRITK